MSSNHIMAIDGLRGWLALWVVGAHALQFAGYRAGRFSGVPRLMQEGGLAVDVFMIISGFVIFGLLDRREETAGQFLARRFFRLYPLYLLMFLCALPLAALNLATFTHAEASFLASQADYWRSAGADYAQTRDWNIPLHLTMLQGLAPGFLTGPYALKAYLPPSWSVSLEWQFYLTAPLLYALVVSGRAGVRLALAGTLAGLIWAGHRWEWNAAFLPLQLEFFVLGALSYFFYRREISHPGRNLRPDTYFPLALVLAVCLFLLGIRARTLIPVCVWLAVLGLLLEQPGSVSRKIQWVLTNPATQFLGKISYSIYLSHWLVLILVQAALARSLPQLEQGAHFWILFGGALAGTTFISALLYHYVEAPGMRLGRAVAQRLGSNRLLPSAAAPAPPIKSVTSM